MKLAAFATALSLMAAPAFAVTLADVTLGTPEEVFTDVEVWYVGGLLFADDLGDFTITAELGSDGSIGGSTDQDLGYFAGLFGALVDIAYSDLSITALFEVTEDTTGQGWGDYVVAVIALPASMGWPPVDLTGLDTGATATVTLSAAAVVPVPATLPLLLGALALGAVARRRV